VCVGAYEEDKEKGRRGNGINMGMKLRKRERNILREKGR